MVCFKCAQAFGVSDAESRDGPGGQGSSDAAFARYMQVPRG